MLAAVTVSVILLWTWAYFLSKRSGDGVDRELENLGSPRLAPRHGKAIICGGGISGLLAAKTCLTHFEQVVLVDPEFSKSRSGTGKARVMQYHSIHLYLFLFVKGICRLWPSFEQKAREAGWQSVYISQPGHYLDGTYIPSLMEAKAPFLGFRRCTLETLLDSLLVEEPEATKRLTIIEGTVRGMKSSFTGGKTITNVYGRGIDERDFEVDDLDLVIDCTGRAQCGTKWLEEASFTPPQCVSYKPHLRYVTITFTGLTEEFFSALPLPEQHRFGEIGFLTKPEVSQKGVAYGRMDNGTAQIAFFSWGPSNLPKQAEDIVPAVTSIGFTKPVPDWFVEVVENLVETGSPVIAPAQLSSCTWLEYHQPRHLPANFIAIGDAVMAVNPIFGQGCGKATSDILLLDSMLRQSNSGHLPSTFSARFFRAQAKRNESMWSFNKALDYAYPTTEPATGETLNSGRFTRWMGRMFMQAGEVDKRVAHVLWLRRHLLVSGAVVLDPFLVGRIVWANIKRALG